MSGLLQALVLCIREDDRKVASVIPADDGSLQIQIASPSPIVLLRKNSGAFLILKKWYTVVQRDEEYDLLQREL